MKLHYLYLFTALIFINACSSPEKPKDFDYGHIENDKYINSYFNMEMDVPSKWYVQSQEQMDQLMNKGKELVAGDDEKLKASLEASNINSANLFSCFKHEPGSAVSYNPSIMLLAENLKTTPGVKTGSDYLFHARKIMTQSQFQYDSLDESFQKEVINGTDFYTMKAQINYMGLNIKQIYYSTVLNDFSVNAIISYIDEEQKNELLKTINSINFKK